MAWDLSRGVRARAIHEHEWLKHVAERIDALTSLIIAECMDALIIATEEGAAVEAIAGSVPGGGSSAMALEPEPAPALEPAPAPAPALEPAPAPAPGPGPEQEQVAPTLQEQAAHSMYHVSPPFTFVWMGSSRAPVR